MSENRNKISVPVLTSLITRPSDSIYVVIEGEDDIFVFRPLMTIFKNKKIIVHSVGGRNNVLSVYNNVKNTPYLKQAIFIVDQDSWIFSGIPKDYQHERIICTSGYSIENDVYIDKKIDSLMHGLDVHSSFESNLRLYLKWFALAITRFCTDNNACGEQLDVHPTAFFKDQHSINTYHALKNGEVFPQQAYDDLLVNYALKFRGKCLLPLAINALGDRPSNPKYNTKTIMEEAVITGRGVHLNRIFSEVELLA